MDPTDPQQQSTLSTSTLDAHIRRRITTFQYIISLYEGKAHYLGIVQLRAEHLLPPKADHIKIRRRIQRWIGLGHALGNLLEIMTVGDFLRQLSGVFGDMESEGAGDVKTGGAGEGGGVGSGQGSNARQRMKRIFLGKASRLSPLTDTSTTLSISDPINDAYADSHHIPFDFDYSQILFAFFDLLVIAYSKLLVNPEAFRNQTYVEYFTRTDSKIKKIIALVLNDSITFSTVATFTYPHRDVFATVGQSARYDKLDTGKASLHAASPCAQGLSQEALI
ncbi:uncharacterized protein EV422DRAFT_623075 [Fimicolochytrium jonesii]|uniref:uncharacterized protein n=1 Tax=Fimicolochytrium jonesii TaxID=1396493 RepID=UPI0022FF267E|nr:uncharacterized protein EV422DRAFT_623075 [Fimicolochytrium jonesii]KAI8816793.1 hypothetical protein EV422DRAFT_623075 [Fimicolochytrium jonesii]